MMHRELFKEQSSLLSFLLRAGDLLVVLVAGWVAYRLYLGSWVLTERYWIPFLLSALFLVWVFPFFGAYRTWRGAAFLDELRVMTLAWGAVFLLLVLLAVMSKTGQHFSRVWGGLWFVMAWWGLAGFRYGVGAVLRRMRLKGLNHRKIVIVGGGDLGAEVVQKISDAPWTGLKITGVFCDLSLAQRCSEINRYFLGTTDCLKDYIENNELDQVWIALPLKEEERMHQIMNDLRHAMVDIRFVPDIYGFRLLNHSVTEVAGLPVVNLSSTPMEGMNRFIKACEDYVLAGMILLLISPLMLVLAVGVKLSSPGPVIFKQKRHGWDGRIIKIYKFRSMRVHKEFDVVTQAQRNDERITPLGSFMRRSSLDELPQFFNVLQGRMSIVGPRPHALAHNEQYKEQVNQYMLRHKVKPGITGWAQINGYRGETDTLDKMQKRIEYDLFYIENWSLWLDIKIILMTVFKGFVGKNAY